MLYKEKLKTADRILNIFKDNLMEILWDDDPFQYCSLKYLIPWLQEEAEYSIKELNLNSEDEDFYLKKINNITGEYVEGV